MNKIQKAIIKGKECMSCSRDGFHDTHHAQEVEKTAFLILEKEKLTEVRSDLLRLAVWWHDCHKGSKPKFRVIDALGESFRGGRIVSRELGKYLSPEDQQAVRQAVENHAKTVRYLLFPNSFSLLDRVLIEADHIGLTDPERWRKGVCKENMSYWQKVVYSLLEIPIIWLLVPRILRFKTSQAIFKKKSKKFWDFFLFKEGYFLKILANRV